MNKFALLRTLQATAVFVGSDAFQQGVNSSSRLLQRRGTFHRHGLIMPSLSSARLYSSVSGPDGEDGNNGEHIFPDTRGLATKTAKKNTSPYYEAPQQQLIDLWNEQVSKELCASLLYTSASIWFRARDMDGMASYMLKEAEEERTHSLAFLDFAGKRNFPIQIQTLPAPKSDWKAPEDVWEYLLEAEKVNTKRLLKLAETAESCHEYSCLAFLNPYHMEQVNSEDEIEGILAKVKGAVNLRQLDYEFSIQHKETTA